MDQPDLSSADICRVCRSEGLPDRPLFHPCICTGSIKWIHQECLTQWMKYSKKEYCELCGYKFSFTPIYSPDMPRRLPIKDVISGLFSSIMKGLRYWFHYTLVALAWLGIVPLTACRIYKCLFTGSFESLYTLHFDILSLDNLAPDIIHGCFVVTCTLFTFIGLVWLREQILHGGGPDWLERENNNAQNFDVIEVNNQDNINNNIPVNENQPGIPPRDNAEEQQPLNVNENIQQNRGDGGGIFNLGLNQPAAERNGNANNFPVNPVQDANVPGVNPIGDVLAEPQLIEQPPPGGAAPADEGNWNPMEWDRAAEELSWERLLGLDGSLVFLEHVFWVVSLNSLFIFIFAFCPYHIGNFAINSLGIREQAAASNFEGLVTTLCGYCVIGLCLVVLHHLAAILGLQKTKRIFGLCYVVVKVSLLTVGEIGVLPLVCGWWLDICSLAMFDATLKDREQSFQNAPGTSMFIHWLVGMVYVYYFASFILLLREILRPGVLWFLRNLNDPDFSPIQEMIHLPILRHIRRLLASAIIFGTNILLMIWIPSKMLKTYWPTFLPYTVTIHMETQVNELSLELLLLQIILPALLEQPHTRQWVKTTIRAWCKVAAWLLGLHSFIFGDETSSATMTGGGANQGAAAPGVNGQQAEQENNQPADLGAMHQALIQRESPQLGFQPYVKPTFLSLRICALIIFTCISLIISSLLILTIPVWLGRQAMDIWLSSSVTLPTTATLTQSPNIPIEAANVTSSGFMGSTFTATRVHEVYTAACGTYICWLVCRAIHVACNWLPQGRAAIVARLKNWFVSGIRAFAACILLIGVIPTLFGLLLELVLVVPLRVPLTQTPVYFIWQDWALGVLYTKIACALIMMGPEWFIRQSIERAYRDGLRDINLKFLCMELALPVIICFGLALSVPYAFAHTIVPWFVKSAQTQNLIARRVYPSLLVLVLFIVLITFQISQFKRLYEHIKNDKYLVGQRLVNYDHRRRSTAPNINQVNTAH